MDYFNHDKTSWNIPNDQTFKLMISDALCFDVDLSSWEVGSETALSVIIFNSVYNQNLCAWGDRLSDLLEI
eukprot:3739721-Ditylum_brightwellii.AAC.1